MLPWWEWYSRKPTWEEFAELDAVAPGWRQHPRYTDCVLDHMWAAGAGPKAFDLSGQGRHGTLSGVLSWDTWREGDTLLSGAGNQDIDVSATPIDFPVTEYTYVFRGMATDHDGNPGFWRSGGNDFNILNHGSSLRPWVRASGATILQPTSGQGWPEDGSLNECAFVFRDSTNIEWWFNGEKKHSATHSSSVSSSAITHLGYQGNQHEHLEGHYIRQRFYTRALGGSEILSLWTVPWLELIDAAQGMWPVADVPPARAWFFRNQIMQRGQA